MTAIGWRRATAGSTGSPVSGAGTVTGVGTGVGVGTVSAMARARVGRVGSGGRGRRPTDVGGVLAWAIGDGARACRSGMPSAVAVDADDEHERRRRRRARQRQRIAASSLPLDIQAAGMDSSWWILGRGSAQDSATSAQGRWRCPAVSTLAFGAPGALRFSSMTDRIRSDQTERRPAGTAAQAEGRHARGRPPPASRPPRPAPRSRPAKPATTRGRPRPTRSRLPAEGDAGHRCRDPRAIVMDRRRHRPRPGRTGQRQRVAASPTSRRPASTSARAGSAASRPRTWRSAWAASRSPGRIACRPR